MQQPAPPFKTLERSNRFEKAAGKLQDAQRKQLAARIELLFNNPAHPSLEAHTVKPGKHYWEAYLNEGHRIIYIPEGSHLFLVDIVAHDDIGRYNQKPKKRVR